MILIAHIGGLPVEEFLTPWASGMAAAMTTGVLLWIASAISRVRHRTP